MREAHPAGVVDPLQRAAEPVREFEQPAQGELGGTAGEPDRWPLRPVGEADLLADPRQQSGPHPLPAGISQQPELQPLGDQPMGSGDVPVMPGDQRPQPLPVCARPAGLLQRLTQKGAPPARAGSRCSLRTHARGTSDRRRGLVVWTRGTAPGTSAWPSRSRAARRSSGRGEALARGPGHGVELAPQRIGGQQMPQHLGHGCRVQGVRREQTDRTTAVGRRLRDQRVQSRLWAKIPVPLRSPPSWTRTTTNSSPSRTYCDNSKDRIAHALPS